MKMSQPVFAKMPPKKGGTTVMILGDYYLELNGFNNPLQLNFLKPEWDNPSRKKVLRDKGYKIINSTSLSDYEKGIVDKISDSFKLFVKQSCKHREVAANLAKTELQLTRDLERVNKHKEINASKESENESHFKVLVEDLKLKDYNVNVPFLSRERSETIGSKALFIHRMSQPGSKIHLTRGFSWKGARKGEIDLEDAIETIRDGWVDLVQRDKDFYITKYSENDMF